MSDNQTPTTSYRPYWKWYTLVVAALIAALIAYVGYYMVHGTHDLERELVLGATMVFLIMVMTLLISYLQEPKKFHDWLDGKDEGPALSSSPNASLKIRAKDKKLIKTNWPKIKPNDN
jgi:high-affinity Fe2+/Pb2+ permease